MIAGRDLALLDIENERLRQDGKWGPQNHPDGTGDVTFVAESKFRRERCDAAFAVGKGTWKDILLEEVWEAMAESDLATLRTELVHVAAVAVGWIESLDRRTSTGTLPVVPIEPGGSTQ